MTNHASKNEVDFATAAGRRGKMVRDALGSAALLDKARNDMHLYFVAAINRDNNTFVRLEVPQIKPEDAPCIEPMFNALKREFPQLNHFRVVNDGVIFDTRPDTRWRRFRVGNGYPSSGIG